jgi:hypothetical protein
MTRLPRNWKIDTKAMDALREIAKDSFDDFAYFGRNASMQKLAARGLVEPFKWIGGAFKTGWQITPAGRQAVEEARARWGHRMWPGLSAEVKDSGRLGSGPRPDRRRTHPPDKVCV